MGSVALLVRRDLRNRWRSLLLLGLVVGVARSVTLADAAGARRTSTALTRFETSSRAADLEFATRLGPRRLGALASIPGVEGIGILRAYGLLSNGLGVAVTRIVPLPALLAVGLGAIVLVNLVATAPGRAAARQQPAAALRTE